MNTQSSPVHQDLLRISIFSAGNDHRLGASEAPPAIVSVFLGDELSEVLESIEKRQVLHRQEEGGLQDRCSYDTGFPERQHRQKPYIAICLYRKQV